MKKLILAFAISGFISLSFNVVHKVNVDGDVNKSQKLEKMDFSHRLDEKRLASWD